MARSVLAWGQTNSDTNSVTASTWFDANADGGGSFEVAATYLAATDYFLIWSIVASSPDEDVEHGFRLYDQTAGTAVDSVTTRITANGTISFFLPIELTPGAVSKTYRIQGNPGSSNGVTIKHAMLTIIPAISGDQYTDTAAGGATTSTSYVTLDTLSWTAGTSEPYLIVGSCRTQSGAYNRSLVRMHDGSTAYGAPDHRLGHKSNIDYPISLVVNATLTGAQAWDLDHATFDAANSVTTSERRILALLLASDYWSNESRTGSASTSSSMTAKASTTQTFQDAPHLVLGSLWTDSPSSAKDQSAELAIASAEAGDSTSDWNQASSNTDSPFSFGYVADFLTIDSRTIALRYASPDNTSTVNAYEAALAVFELSEAETGFGVDIEVDGGSKVEANGTRIEGEFVAAWGIRDDTAETLKLRVNGADVLTTSFAGQTPDAQSGDVEISGPVDWVIAAGFKNTPTADDISDMEDLFAEVFRFMTTSADFSVVAGAADRAMTSYVTDPSGAGWTIPSGDGTVVDVSSTGPDTSAEVTPSATVGASVRGYARLDSANALISDELVRVSVRTINTTNRYSNGYEYRSTIRIPATAIEGSTDLSEFVWLFDQTHNDFRSVTNGGQVESDLGFDIRFETAAGAKLPHHLEYDAVNGRIRALVFESSISASSDNDRYLYVGAAGLPSTEADTNATFAGMFRAYDLSDGSELTGDGATLTSAGATSTGDIGWPGGAFDGTDIKSTPSSPFNGLSSIELAVPFFQADASMVGTNKGWLRENTPDNGDNNSGLASRFMTTSFDGEISNPIHFKVKRSDGNSYAISEASLADSQLHTLHLAAPVGAAPSIWIDGVDRTAQAPQIMSGPLAMQGSTLYVGTGGFGSVSGEWFGTLPFLFVYDKILDEDRRITDHRAWRTPTALAGISEPALSTATAPVVCVPLVATTTTDTLVDIDVVTPAIGTSVSISSIGTPSNGTAVDQGGGVVRYTPGSGFSGSATFSVTLTDSSSNTSSALMRVTVINQDVPGGGGPGADLPNGMVLLDNDIASPNTVAANTGNIQSQINGASPGDVIELATGTYTGSYTISVSGTAANPIKITYASSLHDAVATGRWLITGNYITVDGIKFTGQGRIETNAANYFRISRGYWTSVTNTRTSILLGPNSTNIRVDRCRFDGGVSGTGINYAIEIKPSTGFTERYFHFHHNHFKDFSGSSAPLGACIRLGNTAHNLRELELRALVEFNFFDNYSRSQREVIVGKSSRNWIRYNRFESGGIGDISIRQGRSYHIYGNVMIDSGGISVSGFRHRIYSNYFYHPNRGILIMAGDYRWAGTTDSRQPGFNFPTGNSNLIYAKPTYDASDRCIVANNTIIYDGGLNASTVHDGALTVGSQFDSANIQFAARDIDVINNLVIRDAGSFAALAEGDRQNIRYAGNITNVSLNKSGWSNGSPTFTADADGIRRPNIGAVTGGVNVTNYGPLGFTLETDIDGQSPDGLWHIGADQITGSGVAQAPASASDVGYSVADIYA